MKKFWRSLSYSHRMKKCLLPGKQAQFSPIWIVFLCTKKQNFSPNSKIFLHISIFLGNELPKFPIFSHHGYSTKKASANGHCTPSQYSARRATNVTELQCIWTNQKFHHKFSVFECMKIAQNYAQVSLPLSHTVQYFKMLIFCWKALFIRKMKIKMADRKKHVFSKVVKNIIFQNKTLLVMFYRHNKTFWYQFCNFKHFLKAENGEASRASSCEEFCISFPVTQYETGLLVHGIKPVRLNGSFDSKRTRPETSHSYQSFTILINTSTGIIVDLNNLRFKWHNNSKHQTVK